MAILTKRGVEGSSFDLLELSGSIDLSFVCHLLNPANCVANPKNRVTDNYTSPTIALLHNSGFSLEKALIFDQVCRSASLAEMFGL